MRNTSWRAVVGTLVVAGLAGLLGACATGSEGSPLSPTTGHPAPADRVPPIVSTDRPPLGFEIRYVDANGRFATVPPEDFRR